MKWIILMLLSIYFNKFVLSFSIRENETRIEGNIKLSKIRLTFGYSKNNKYS